MKKYVGPIDISKIANLLKEGLSKKEDNMEELNKDDIHQMWSDLKDDSSSEVVGENIEDWEYELDDEYVTLKRYTGSETEIIVYPSYRINDNIYYTKIGNSEEYKSLFRMLTRVTSIEFKEGIDYSECINMSQMFNSCSSLMNIIIPNDFDTSNVTDMKSMFTACTSLTSEALNPVLKKFNTEKVTNMGFMFERCNKLTELDLTSFDTKSVTVMNSMFRNDSLLTSILVTTGKWVMPTYGTAQMFEGCATEQLTYV